MRPAVWIAIGVGAALSAGVVGVALAKPSLAPWRSAMISRASHHVATGTLYQWGGGHPGVPNPWGLDCSGLIIDCARAAGFVLEWNSNSMWQLCPHVVEPEPGDVALFGYNNKAVHVMLVERWYRSEGRAACIGSQNGDQTTVTPEIAKAMNAHVMRVPDHRADKRFLGFATLAKIQSGEQDGRILRGMSLKEQFG